MTVADLLSSARRLQKAGDFAGAEESCRQTILLEPASSEAWYQLGCACKPLGKQRDALSAFQRAVAIEPNYYQAHNMLGIVLLELGQMADAAGAFENALRGKPDFAIAYNNLGNAQLALGRTDQALASYQEAVRINPEFAEAHGNLGNVLRELGRLGEALESCQLALRLKPSFIIGHNHLGGVYSSLRQWDNAAACFREAVSLHPHYLEARVNLSDALRELGRLEESETNLRETLRLWPESPDAHVSLGLVLLQQDKLEAAENACREALRLKPGATTVHLALGMACQLQGRPSEALACYNRALELDPASAEARKNRGIVRLELGDFAGGWDDYEWRWKCPDLSARRLAQPMWDGSPLEGKTILLHAEQGLGDTLQFVRYAPLVRERGGRVILACQRSLLPLLRGCGGIDELISLSDPPPQFDVHAPLMSLPGIFRTTLETVPAKIPYIEPDPRLVDYWREELKSVPGFKVGIAWQGSRDYRFDRLRSMPLVNFTPLADLPGVTLLSLQKGFGSEQWPVLADRGNAIDLSSRLDESSGPFLDTAAVMKCLDLVVSCDSSIAHLAGALGARVWLASSLSGDWRWLRDRDRSPWYPTMRLFRQQRRGDWEYVFKNIAAALAETMESSRLAASVTIEVSPGELIDRMAKLEVKLAQIRDEAKSAQVSAALAALRQSHDRSIRCSAALDELAAQLRTVHETLCEAEAEIRLCQRDGDFGPRFVKLARTVQQQHDRRTAIRCEIDEILGPRIVEG